jgi:hypothetical protein
VEAGAEQDVAFAQESCGKIWATAVKLWRKAAEAGQISAQWYLGQCYYYGRDVVRDAAQANDWFRKAAAIGDPAAAQALQWLGIPRQGARGVIARFTNAGSAPPRYAAAHDFARIVVNETFLGPQLQCCDEALQEVDSVMPHQSLRDSTWVEFMVATGVSDEELEVAKRIFAYSLRTCTFCGSSSAPLRKCSLCMELRYCIGTDCQHADWKNPPRRSPTRCCAPASSWAGARGRRAGRDCG